MSSLANNRRTKPAATKDNFNDDIVLKSLKESLNSIILKDAENEEQRQRHNKRLSRGAQKIMDRLASLRSDDIPTESFYHHHRRRRLPATKQTSHEKDVKGNKHEDVHDVKNNDHHDHHPPRLIHSSSLDTSSYSFASSSTLDLDTSFANSLDDSFRRALQSHRGLKNNMKRSSCTSTEHHQSHQQKEKRTVLRRKSIPRHRDSDLNSSISSCLRPAKYTSSISSSSSAAGSNSIRSSALTQSFNSSLLLDMDDFNKSDSSWVASGVVIAESMEVIHLK
jgi:hypothetical protein